MQHDTNPPTAGVDWATDTNELCIVDAVGAVLARRNTAQMRRGSAGLSRRAPRTG